MRGGFDRLVKEIDALTYNARSSINAMIRSTIAAGTTNGFKAIRAGIEILLTREDIYRLDKFYKQWEESNFDTSIFDDIIADAGASDALVKHSKILYLNNDTIGQIDATSYWLGLIKVANNPKLISNSAPIPINIRTPIFDENMATTKYNQEETYLFPFSYYSVDLLGYSGDEVDHHMDGKSWTISADDYISMETDAFSTGGVNASDTRKTKARRNHDVSNGNAYEVTYSTANGYATQARAKYSHASGLSSVVPRGAVSGVAIGDRLLSSESYAVSIGGSLNKSVGIASAVIGGSGNVAAGAYGVVIGGINNSIGSAAHIFKFPIGDSNSSSCITVTNDCENNSIVFDSSGVYAGKNIISITDNVVNLYEVGATVAIHTLSTFSNTGTKLNYWETDGDGFKTQYFSITSVEYIDPNTYSNNVNKGNTLITLSGDIAGYHIDGGYITKVVDVYNNKLGYSSVAMNNSNIALGEDQTVVGRYNYPVAASVRFIIGNGINVDTANRSNVVEVYDDGMTIYGTKFNSIYNTSTAMLSDNTSVFHKFDYIGVYSKVRNSKFNLINNYSELSVGNYIGIYQSNISTDYNLMLSSYEYPLILRSGKSRIYKKIPTYTDILISSESSVLIESSNYITLDADNSITVSTNNEIIVNWEKTLKLYGDTFGALPTSDDQYSHYISFKDINKFTEKGTESSFGGIIKSGFYDILNTGTGNDFTRTYSDLSRMKSCQFLNVGDYDKYNSYAWKLMFPTMIGYTEKIPNIAVMYNETDTDGNETQVSKSRAPRYLAYKDEISGMYSNNDASSAISSIGWVDVNGSFTSVTEVYQRGLIIKELVATRIAGAVFIRLAINFNYNMQINANSINILFNTNSDFYKKFELNKCQSQNPISSMNTNIIYTNASRITETTAYAKWCIGVFNNTTQPYIKLYSKTSFNSLTSEYDENNDDRIAVFNLYCPLSL